MTTGSNDQAITDPEDLAYTHKATMTVYSNASDPNVAVKVVWVPDLRGVDFPKLGYMPASFKFIEEYILPAIEEAYVDYEIDPLLAAASPSGRAN